MADVTLRNKDSATLVAKIKVAPPTVLQTSEQGASAAFTMVLGYRPTADVVVPLSSSNPTAGLPDVSAVTFTPADWNLPHTVIVTGQNDSVSRGDVRYTVATGPATSSDLLYAGMDALDVRLRNRHNTDRAQFGSGIYGGSYGGTWSGTLTCAGYGAVPVGGDAGIAFNYRGGVTARFYGVDYLGLIHLPVIPIYGAVTSVNAVEVGAVRFSLSESGTFRFLGTGRVTLYADSPHAIARGTWAYASRGISAHGSWDVRLS